jgi:hypothetical protein
VACENETYKLNLRELQAASVVASWLSVTVTVCNIDCLRANSLIVRVAVGHCCRSETLTRFVVT